MPSLEVRTGTEAQPSRETFDAVFVNAGVTHPLDAWLDALGPGARLVLPMTSTMVPMGNVGKGVVFTVTRDPDAGFSARVIGVVAIYSARGVRTTR